MATTIDLSKITKTATQITLDFYFLKITFNGVLNAKFLFLALLELEKYSHDSFADIMRCFNLQEQQEFLAIKNIGNSEGIPLDEAKQQLLYHDHIAYINKWLLKNNMPPMESLGHKLLESIVNYKAINIVSLIMDFINSKDSNSSLIEFNVNDSSDGLEIKNKQELVNEIRMCNGDINKMAGVIFLAYKKDYINIYEKLCESIVSFLAQFK